MTVVEKIFLVAVVGLVLYGIYQVAKVWAITTPTQWERERERTKKAMDRSAKAMDRSAKAFIRRYLSSM